MLLYPSLQNYLMPKNKKFSLHKKQLSKIIKKNLPKKPFSSLKPTDWGKGTEHTSEEIDKILYGK